MVGITKSGVRRPSFLQDTPLSCRYLGDSRRKGRTSVTTSYLPPHSSVSVGGGRGDRGGGERPQIISANDTEIDRRPQNVFRLLRH